MFIVLESIDGGGKGEQRKQLEKFMIAKGLTVKTMEFPDHSTSVWNDYLHPALHGEKYLTPGAWFSAFAFEKFLWEEELKKYKEDRNNFFIADGYYTTTLAYQCMLQNCPSLEFGLQFAEEFNIVKPDLAVFLDVHPKTAMERKRHEEGKHGDSNKDIFESNIEKQQSLHNAFSRMVKDQVWCKWVSIDGNGTIPEVRDSIFTHIQAMLSV